MPLITDRQAVLAIYEEARQKGWVIPCFCTENLTTTEAILTAVLEHGAALDIPNLPVSIGITVRYGHRTQAEFYTQTRCWDIGLRLLMAEIAVLAAPGSPFADLRIMTHLDHIQFDDDRELLDWDLSGFSSIMFDASKAPFAENIALTRQFVREQGGQIVIEGACDEIVDATGAVRSDLTTPERAAAYFAATGADLIVANLGTEHRASAETLHYHGEMARLIRDRIGNRIVLHGASSVPGDQIARLADDGICKVNLWTALERDSAPVLLAEMVRHAVEVAGPTQARRLQQEGLLGAACPTDGRASLDYFTTTWRQTLVFGEMKHHVRACLELWYH